MSGVIVSPYRFSGTTLDLVDDFAGSFFDFLEYYETADDFVTLMVPGPGSYDDGAPSGPDYIPRNVGYNSPGFLVKGYGSPNPSIWVGALACKGTGEYHHEPYTGAGRQLYNPKFETVSAGSYSVTIIDPLDDLYLNPPNPHVSHFQVGRWALLFCWDMQSYGYPPNNYFFEYKQIADVNRTTGVITFTEPLTQNYKSTYPQIFPGQPEDDPGGPATIMPMGPDFGKSYTWENMNFGQNTTAQFYGAANLILVKNCQFPDPAYPTTPTFCNTFTHEGCTFSGNNFEIDKLVTNLNFINCTFDTVGVNFQSASIENVLFEDCTLINSSSIGGCGKNITINNCTGSLLRFRPGYGHQKSATVSDSHFDLIDYNNVGFFIDLITDNGSFETDGTIVVDRDVARGTDILLTLTPTSYCAFHATAGGLPLLWFRVDDCIETGGNFVYTTNLADILVDDFATQMTALLALTGSIGKQPCQSVTFTNTTTNNNLGAILSRAPAGRPYWSYFHTGTLQQAGSYGSDELLSGAVESLKINVITPYTGTRPTLFIKPLNHFFGVDFLHNIVDFTFDDYLPLIDAKTAGLRTITPSGVTGTAGADSGLTFPVANPWVRSAVGSGFGDGVDISGESSSVYPVYTVELICDQGIT